MEDAGAGSVAPVLRLLRRRGGRRIDRAQMAKARAAADLVGRAGEELVATYLEAQVAKRAIERFVWTANENAVSPFDFEITASAVRLVEVKATSGVHGRAFHISMAEIEVAASAPHYDLYRVSEVDVTASTGVLHIALDIAQYARQVLAASKLMPAGPFVDGVSIEPAVFQQFTRVETITIPVEE